MLASYMDWKCRKVWAQQWKRKRKIKQKPGGSGVGDAVKINVRSVNKNWIQTWGPVVRWKIWMEIHILFCTLKWLVGVMDVKPAEWNIALGKNWGVQIPWELLPSKLQISSSEVVIYSVLIFLSQDICFWLGLKPSILSQAWAHQTASVQAKLRIYPGALSFELRQSLNQVNGGGKIGLEPLKLCPWDQGWWRTQDWSGGVIEKRGGSRGRKVEKKCESWKVMNTTTYHTVDNTYQWILDSVALLV